MRATSSRWFRRSLASLGMRVTRALLACTLCALAVAQPAVACTVCMGSPGDPLVKGANNGIWVLLAVVAFVQIGFISLFIAFWKRARQQKKFREQFRVVPSSADEWSAGDLAREGTTPASPATTARWFRRSLASLGINTFGGSQ